MYAWEVWARENLWKTERVSLGTSVRVCQGCPAEFEPLRAGMIWCSHKCRSRAAMRAMRERKKQLA
jgi:hypothetical protein